MERFFIPVLYTVLQLITMMAIGFFLKKKRILPDSFFSTLSVFLVEVALPLYIFTKVTSTDRSILTGSWIFPLAAAAYVVIGLLLGFIVFHMLSFHGVEKRAGIALSTFGNSAYIPLSLTELFPFTVPFIAETFGSAAPTLYISTFVLVLSPLLWSIGYALITGTTKDLRLSRILNPPIVAILLGFFFLFTGLNEFFIDERSFLYHIFAGAKTVGSTTLPLILISIGAMIAGLEIHVEGKKKLLKMAFGVASVRFLLMPAFFFLSYFLVLRHLAFLTPAHLWVLFLEAHVPPANNLALMANRAGVNRGYTAFTTLITYGGYLIVLPLYISLFLSIL